MSFVSQKMREDIMAHSLIYSSKKVIKTEIKVENFILHLLLRFLAKEGVGKRFFDLFLVL